MFSRQNGDTFVFEDSDNNEISIARSALKQSTRAPRTEELDGSNYFITLSDADESQNFNTGNNNATAQYYQDDVVTVGGKAKPKAKTRKVKARKVKARKAKTRARK